MSKRKIIILAVIIGVFAVSMTMVIKTNEDYRKIRESNAAAQNVANAASYLTTQEASMYFEKTPAQETEENADDTQSQTQETEEEINAIPEGIADLAEIDLNTLKNVNPDIIGWITIPGTNISYPLLKGEDNEHYLHYDWQGEESAGGAVFMESTNDADFYDYHTIIYGHRMRDGSMFGSLDNYLDPEFLKEHPSIYLVTSDHIFKYDIFSVFSAKTDAPIYKIDLETAKYEFVAYLNKSTEVETDIEGDSDADILTLSTCTGDGYSKRFTVSAYLSEMYNLG